MKRFLEALRPFLENRPPPTDVKELGGVFCVLINHNWQRARLLQAKFSHAGTIEVICIDSDDTNVVPLTFVRTLDIPGIEADNVRDWPPLATKCRLADVVAAPVNLGSCRTDQTMMFMQVHALNNTWKAAIVDIHDDKLGMRLCSSVNKLLATLMIEQDVGIPTSTYTEARNMMQGFTYSAGDTKLIEKVISLKTQNCISVDVLPNETENVMENTLEVCTVVTSTLAERGSDLVDGSNMDVMNEVLGAPSNTAVPPPSAGYTYLPVSQTPFDVSIAWYYNPDRFFIKPVDLSAYQNELDELEEFYSSLSPDVLLEDQAYVGLPCVARFTEDGRFYRSKILAIVDQVAKVLFVDYGNEQETPISQLRRMVPRFMQCPQLTWHSRLKGVIKKTFGPTNPDPQRHIAACFLTGQTLSALFYSTSPDRNNEIFEVKLNVPGIGDVAQYLIAHRVLDRISLD